MVEFNFCDFDISHQQLVTRLKSHLRFFQQLLFDTLKYSIKTLGKYATEGTFSP